MSYFDNRPLQVRLWLVLFFFPFYLFGQEATHYFSNEVASRISQEARQAEGAPFEALLPLENGEQVRFRIQENNTLSKTLGGAFSDIYSLDVVAIDQANIFGKINVAGDKLLGTIVTPRGILSISPSIEQEEKLLIFTGDQSPEMAVLPENRVSCAFDENFARVTRKKLVETRNADLSSGAEIKTYRMAIAVTGEFYQLNGGTDADANLAIAFAINGLNLVYERDLSINFTLVNMPLLYDDRNTDLFTPDQAGGDSRPDQARAVINNNFTNGQYDIGHVLHRSSPGDDWSGGGVAYLGVVCNNNFNNGNDGRTGAFKGGGWSGSSSSTSLGWILLFAHEVGHMFRAEHTFNGSGSSCTSNIAPNNSFEIGSGTTIMAYPGLCQSSSDISNNRDNYFHTASITQMYNYSESVGCGTRVASGNTAPEIDANPNGLNYTIPVSTPFELEGMATDADGDPLNYTWEQMDEDGDNATPTQGFLGATAGASPIAPLFRSLPPSDSPKRIFPSLPSILAGNNTGQDFEALPSVPRSMTFAFTVRDNNIDGGATLYELVDVEVEDTGGPFEVTSQNMPSTFTYNGSNTMTVEWAVAGTTGGTILCSNVDIYFSADDGTTFPYLLASSTPNDGMTTITVPNISTVAGRIKVKGSNHLFFDINNVPITIVSNCIADAATFSPADDLTATAGSVDLDLSLSPEYGTLLDPSGTIDDTDLPGNLVGYNTSGNCTNFSNAIYSEHFSFQVDQPGTYTFNRPNFITGVMIYQDEFIPNSRCTNLLASSVTNSTITNSASVDLIKGKTYVLVIMDDAPSSTNYTVNFSGPGDLYDGPPPPGSAYAYTYAIVNLNNNQITNFQDDPDLSNAGQYPAGNYQITGISYDNASFTLSSLNSNYTGISITSFQNMLFAQGSCLDLSSNTKNITIEPMPGIVLLDLKVLLQGPLEVGTNTMRDDLRVAGTIPLSAPYVSAPLTTTMGILNTNSGTTDAVVDWVLIELRSAADPAQVMISRSGLLQRDGDVVSAVDGSSLLSFMNLPQSSYYVAIKHRNHLGVMTASAVPFSVGQTLVVDFTNRTAAEVYNSTPAYDGAERAEINGRFALWAGDVNMDGKIKYQGTAADDNNVFIDAINHPDNTFNLYNFDLGVGYSARDTNMDGKIKYQGVNNDVLPIFLNILNYAPNIGSLPDYDFFVEQIPN